MSFTPIAKLGAASALALSLAACMDVAMTIDVTSETEAEATMVTSMGTDMYEMMNAQAVDGDEEFCAEGELVQNVDTVDCTVVQSGTFDALDLDSEGGGPVIEAIGDGRVRVAFPTGEMASALAEDTGVQDDPQMMAMMSQMFEGHFISMTVSGGSIGDTNMDIAPDGMSATYEIPFVDLLMGELDVPAEVFAVVQK